MMGPGTFRLVGLDPGLRHTGWGIIDVSGNRLSHVANGAVHSDSDLSLAERLVQLHDGLTAVIERWQPDEAAVAVFGIVGDLRSVAWQLGVAVSSRGALLDAAALPAIVDGWLAWEATHLGA